jgi:hypothetical protein
MTIWKRAIGRQSSRPDAIRGGYKTPSCRVATMRPHIQTDPGCVGRGRRDGRPDRAEGKARARHEIDDADNRR